MATKFVFNPFTGNLDVVNVAEEAACPIVEDWPIYADDTGGLRMAPMLRTTLGDCLTTANGEIIHATDPYTVPVSPNTFVVVEE